MVCSFEVLCSTSVGCLRYFDFGMKKIARLPDVWDSKSISKWEFGSEKIWNYKYFYFTPKKENSQIVAPLESIQAIAVD